MDRRSSTDIPYHLTDFFGIAGLSSSLLGSVITSVVGLCAAIVAFFLIEMKSVGRWVLVFWGVVFITLAMRKALTDVSAFLFIRDRLTQLID